MEEARRRIELILDPPTADLGAEYTGRVVNITKFGAFVNVLPGKDGLLHISKLGRGKRIDRVEDVLNLGDEVTVRVDDIDNARQALAVLVGDDDDDARPPAGNGDDAPSRSAARPRREGSDRDRGDRDRGDRDRMDRAPRPERAEPDGGREVASFEDQWEEQARAEFGDLGPAESRSRRWTQSRRRWGRRRRTPSAPASVITSTRREAMSIRVT